ncbi:conserved hypothetical protein [Tenacibaculum maritimum]|uniref:hypothetical protein n=1 Tax=Tenacibaculum maritimum TaxID=107401 RepID=UPI0012E48992|nr:hypothetical protein [Tenacibaculum maritimum]MCD9582294.1 hypothetical protein [Tenacibaculum maritimum]MCD9636676.1 hypothetical protein [Tenacibaculum maritimum]CAA0144765.1 conserved hypothetical protein [Tenacibaculum maritimum]CAA0193104.1 conserved hypothetical protein [Tenacibaculum maritimum]
MSIEFKDDFFEKLKRVDKSYFLKKMTKQMGIIAVNFSKERFRDKNWLGRNREKWPDRKRKGRGSLMNNSGRLKRSIRKISEGNYYVFIGSDIPYAQINNEGGIINKTVSVRSHTRKLNTRTRRTTRGNGRSRKPLKTIAQVKSHNRRMNLRIAKRQFMGNSEILTRRIEKHLYKEIDKELNR